MGSSSIKCGFIVRRVGDHTCITEPVRLSSRDLAASLAQSPRDDLEPDEDADIINMIQEADRTDTRPGTVESFFAIFDKLCRDYPCVSAEDLQRKLKRPAG
jgi:hypothetical protein